MTCETTSTPSARRNAFASAPPATRAAVSRALARSSTLRTSVKPNFWTPARSAWPGPREVDLRHVGLDRPRVHPLLPVGEVAVGDRQRDRAAERAAVADAGGDLGGVALDLHPPAAAVAELAARHVAVDGLGVELEAGRQALDHAGQAGPVGFPGGDHAQRHGGGSYEGAAGARARRALGRDASGRGRSRRPWPARTRATATLNAFLPSALHDAATGVVAVAQRAAAA